MVCASSRPTLVLRDCVVRWNAKSACGTDGQQKGCLPQWPYCGICAYLCKGPQSLLLCRWRHQHRSPCTRFLPGHPLLQCTQHSQCGMSWVHSRSKFLVPVGVGALAPPLQAACRESRQGGAWGANTVSGYCNLCQALSSAQCLCADIVSAIMSILHCTAPLCGPHDVCHG